MRDYIMKEVKVLCWQRYLITFISFNFTTTLILVLSAVTVHAVLYVYGFRQILFKDTSVLFF